MSNDSEREQSAETDETPCVHEDSAADLPLIPIPAYDTGFGTVPAKRWCWTHGRWETVSSPERTVVR